MSELEEAAARFKAWAAEKGILSYIPPDEPEDYNSEPLEDLTDAADPTAASDILLHRKINLVLVNEEQQKIIVCTHRKISAKELDVLPTNAENKFPIEYLKSAPPQVRMAPAGPTPIPPFSQHNNRYTCGSSISVGNCIEAGTLGCLVRDQNGDLFGLTNNHVSGGCGYSEPNLPIVAPGLADVRAGGRDPFTIGHHHSITPWVSGSPENANVADNLDAAIFRVLDPALVSSMQRGAFDTPANVMAPKSNIVVDEGRQNDWSHTR